MLVRLDAWGLLSFLYWVPGMSDPKLIADIFFIMY